MQNFESLSAYVGNLTKNLCITDRKESNCHFLNRLMITVMIAIKFRWEVSVQKNAQSKQLVIHAYFVDWIETKWQQWSSNTAIIIICGNRFCLTGYAGWIVEYFGFYIYLNDFFHSSRTAFDRSKCLRLHTDVGSLHINDNKI